MPCATLDLCYFYGVAGNIKTTYDAKTERNETLRYTYNANSNMTERTEGDVTYRQTFDIENRLVSVTVNGQTTTFTYDGACPEPAEGTATASR